MTTAGQREDRFSDITKVRALGTRFYAMSGERNTVIVASNVANVATVVGETAALGSDARDIASNGSTQLYILTDLGLQVATLADTPILGTRHAFNPGAGRWVIYSGGYVFAPAPGGLRVIDPALGEVSLSTVGGVADIALARLTSDGLIYGVDQKRAKIHVWRIIGARAKYISSYAAYNCRDIVQVLIDETAHILFVQCKHRIVGFNIPSSGAVDDSITVTLRQDYGKLAEDYTDFVKIGTNKYWTGVNADSPLNAGSAFLGRAYADWDVTNQSMVTAFPDMALLATSDVTPYTLEVSASPNPGISTVPDIIPPPTPATKVPPVFVPVVIPTGRVWTSRSTPADNAWSAVCYGNGLFVAVAYSGTGNRVMTSPDGVTWTIRTSAEDNDWVGVAYGNGLFVAVAFQGSGNRVMTSPDGVTWTPRAVVGARWRNVCYGNGLFVAVADDNGTQQVMTSPDGVTWAMRNTPANNLWYAVTYGNGLFVAVAASGTGNRVMTSPDGVTWTIRVSAADNAWHSICYGNGLFVAVGFTGVGNRIMTSPDGVTWTTRSNTTDNGWLGVAFSGTQYTAVAVDGLSAQRVMLSLDGIIWTDWPAPTQSWRSMCYGNSTYVAVAYTGTGNRAMTSPG